MADAITPGRVDLGAVSAYAVAVEHGFDGTEAEWEEYIANASNNAAAANTSKLAAEGYAVGKQNGVDVPSTSPYFENNSKYYMEQAKASVPTDYTELIGDVEDLKSAITTITGRNAVEMTNGKVVYIQNNQDNSLTPSDSQLYRCAVVSCSAGDVFTINATGRTAGRPWAFVDSNGRIVDGKAAEYSNNDVVVTNLIITAPSGVSYLVVNDRYSGGVSIYGENIDKDITDLTDNVFYNTVTPFDFGAKGDGTTDDTSALQACFNAAVANSCNVQIPRAVYLTSGVTISGYCNIFGNGATLKYSGSDSTNGYVIRVNATNNGLRGVVRDLVIDCNQTAKSGIKVDLNINVIDFEHIQIVNLYTNGYGLYLSADDSPTSAQGRYKTFDIRCNVRNNSARGLYLLSHDAYFYDIKCVNCRYGAWSEVLACFVNFHPFNTYAELMTNSIGLYTTGLTFITNSYIDTFAKCFGGTGFISIDSLEVFWSTGYYTDESVGDSTTRPIIFDPGLRVFNLKGMRVYPPRGRTVQKSNFTSDPSLFYLYNNPRQGNVLEGVSNVPTRQYASETLTTETGVTDRYTKLYRYDEMIVIYTEIEVSGLTTTSYKDLATVPSNSKPKTDKSWICAARNSQTASNRTCVEVTLNASSGKLSARAIFGNLSDANKIVISQEYKVASD